MYSKRLSVKYQSLIKHVYEYLNVEELKKLKLTVEKSQVSKLKIMKTCVKCKKVCYQEKDIVKCRTCAYWIHNNTSYFNITLKYGKCCPNCYYMINVLELIKWL